jgi:carboxypeptidase D
MRVWPNECFQGAGMQGFQKPILVDSFVVGAMGSLGQMQIERGLTYVEISLAGHL